MSLVNALRQCQLDIRLAQNKLQEINSDEKGHPDRAPYGGSGDQVRKWEPIKRTFDKRRKLLKERLAELQEERGELEASLHSKGMSKASVGHVLNQLLEIEVKFTSDTWEDAWESLTAFIDWLEKEEQKLSARPELKAVV